MSKTAEQIVWEGAEALRPFLVPIDTLEPFPGNPRQGDVAAVRASLRRFGQVKPLLLDAALGTRIVAGHHVRLAAQEEGWTHIAAIPNKFADEEEARAYLLADNRTSDLGGYDLDRLVTHLQALAELDALEGTGYTRDDLDHQLAELKRLRDETPRAPRDPSGNGNDADLKEVVLLFSEAHHKQFELWLGIVAKEKGTDGPSETTYAALQIAAKAVNQA